MSGIWKCRVWVVSGSSSHACGTSGVLQKAAIQSSSCDRPVCAISGQQAHLDLIRNLSQCLGDLLQTLGFELYPGKKFAVRETSCPT
jgi:hypothetical protein